jgi:hypothetical protein
MNNPVVLEDKMYTEVKNMNAYIFPYTGKYTIRLDGKSNQKVVIEDGENKKVEILSPGHSITHSFEHQIRVRGTGTGEEDAAYIHLGVHFENKGSDENIFPYTGVFIISSESRSKHQVHIYDGDGRFKTILPPGSSIIHLFQHCIKIKGTSDKDTDTAYIYLAHQMEFKEEILV